MVNTNPNTRKDRNGRWAHHFIADNLRRVAFGGCCRAYGCDDYTGSKTTPSCRKS